ncbi:unnamed protein product [Moneuplotes crassus]|uniref:Transaldolase n=1 Tax=Euplotes crassus TaxID=5936 RepID=A0AAD1UNC7_EUPCR|nr:unnamed protein product [Moneuplotes crassus]
MPIRRKRTAKLIGRLLTKDQFSTGVPNKRRKISTKKSTTKKAAKRSSSTKKTSKAKKKRDAKAKSKASTSKKTIKGNSKLAQLKKMTTVVADTGDFHLIKKYKPTDATTNPSLLLAASKMTEYDSLIDEAIRSELKNKKVTDTVISDICDKLAVIFGTKILDIVPGYVSTEVDARLSFDTKATVAKARKIIKLYKAAGVKKDRILIKIASTWEGIQAARILQKEGISCNLTLLFNFFQALACAQANATLISPFVGRILDWYKKSTGKEYKPEKEPGVFSVTRIYNYYKKYGHNTFVMGASFRNSGEIINLAGCDRLTISPALLEELETSKGKIQKKLDRTKSKKECKDPKVKVTESLFRWEMNEDAMATEKLSEGIRKFSEDLVALEGIIRDRVKKSLKKGKK